jgi:hypothetical protein
MLCIRVYQFRNFPCEKDFGGILPVSDENFWLQRGSPAWTGFGRVCATQGETRYRLIML